MGKIDPHVSKGRPSSRTEPGANSPKVTLARALLLCHAAHLRWFTRTHQERPSLLFSPRNQIGRGMERGKSQVEGR